jgi:(2R)-sulfolactate sulfo-lyase subunit alpha
MPHAFLVHNEHDHVGVAVRDIEANEEVEGLIMDTGARVSVRSRGAIPLGHKIALSDLPKGAEVLKYQVTIGITSTTVTSGDYVHTHNIRSGRW